MSRTSQAFAHCSGAASMPACRGHGEAGWPHFHHLLPESDADFMENGQEMFVK
jgi:hypothetical protein